MKAEEMELMDKYVIESEFEHLGMKCVVVMQELGHRCGYV